MSDSEKIYTAARITMVRVLVRMTDLPPKVQTFIDTIKLDTAGLELFYLGDASLLQGTAMEKSNAFYNKALGTIHFVKRIGVRTTIHELMHHFLSYTDINTKAVAERFVEQYGFDALNTFAGYHFYCGNWDEVICEIVGVFGSRGQFSRIKEILGGFIRA